jgi:transcriptional regulator with XRE-family HTH domain
LIEDQRPRGKVLFQPARPADIRGVVEAAVAGFDGNQAALALELGVTRATVSRWMSGQNIPDEGSCLRLAKITGRSTVDVFRMAGRDTSLLPVEPELPADAELHGRLRQWARRLSELSAADRTVVVGVLDDVLKSLCQRLNQGAPRQEVSATRSITRHRRRDGHLPDGRRSSASPPASTEKPGR